MDAAGCSQNLQVCYVWMKFHIIDEREWYESRYTMVASEISRACVVRSDVEKEEGKRSLHAPAENSIATSTCWLFVFAGKS